MGVVFADIHVWWSQIWIACLLHMVFRIPLSNLQVRARPNYVRTSRWWRLLAGAANCGLNPSYKCLTDSVEHLTLNQALAMYMEQVWPTFKAGVRCWSISSIDGAFCHTVLNLLVLRWSIIGRWTILAFLLFGVNIWGWLKKMIKFFLTKPLI